MAGPAEAVRLVRQLIALTNFLVKVRFSSIKGHQYIQHTNHMVHISLEITQLLAFLYLHICDRIWEKVHYGAYFQNRVLAPRGRVSSQL